MKRLMDRVRTLLAVLGPLGAGSRVLLLRMAGRWGWWPVLGGAVLAVYVAFRYRTWIVWMLVAFAAAAWMHAPDDAKQPSKAGEQASAEAPVDPLPGILWKLIDGAPGVHVKALAEYLQAAAPEEVVDRATVRAALAARRIPVRGSVRGADGRVNEGVHRDDLKAWQEALSPAPSEAAPEVRSKPVATAVTCDVAGPATGVATPSTTVD